MFGEFFNSETLAQVIDRKADIELINRLQDSKANQSSIDEFNNNLTEINDKLQHLTLFTNEIAQTIIPQNKGKFTSDR